MACFTFSCQSSSLAWFCRFPTAPCGPGAAHVLKFNAMTTMHSQTLFELSKEALRQLRDDQLEELVFRLAEAEVKAKGGPISAVRGAGSSDAADGGVDVRVNVPSTTGFQSDFLPCANVIFQVKKHTMPPGKIKAEMCPRGHLRPSIADQANGAYILVSLEDDCSDSMFQSRRKAMKKALADHPNQHAIQLDFYDRSKLHQWLRQHSSVTVWLRNISRWSHPPANNLLDSIRTTQIEPDAQKDLKNFCDSAFSRWQGLIKDLPEKAPQRYLHGFYEMGFALQDATIVDSLNTLKQRLAVDRRIRTTGWSPFLELPGLQPSYASGQEIIEAWLGQPRSNMFMERIAFSTFWRVSRDGKLYTLTGYKEDDPSSRFYGLTPGQDIEIGQPVWRVGEAAYFVERFCAEFPEVENVLIYLKFSGLEGRKLTSTNNSIWMLDEEINRTPESIELKDSVSVRELQNNMVEVIHKLLKPLYETFGFFQLDLNRVDETLSSLRRG